MIAGCLKEKKGYYHVVLSWYVDGKRKYKWFSTHIKVKNRKTQMEAEQKLCELRQTFNPETTTVEITPATTAPVPVTMNGDMLFADFLDYWLKNIVKHSVQEITFGSYYGMSDGVIMPYFKDKGIKLSELRPIDIQNFYSKELERVKASTVIHYHVVIRKALKYAVNNAELLTSNPADKIERPKVDRFIGSFYNKDEANKLIEVVRGSWLELPVLLSLFYGLRRSEAVGLKWSAIDFTNDTITINHTVTYFSSDKRKVICAADRTKNKSSMRTLPLIPEIKEKLLAVRATQEQDKEICGKCYSSKYLDYICVDQLGELYNPGYISNAFGRLLKKNGLRKIRFHDLRHSCASLLISKGVPLKQIQEWLGHSDITTTGNIYSHLEYESKVLVANALAEGLTL